MINREIYLKDITDSFALLSREVLFLDDINLYDINIIAEDFFSGLFNLIYGYEFENNFIKNLPAIDLADRKNRIAVQVTSDNNSSKIKETIKLFLDNHLYRLYDRLIVFILTEKKNYTTDFNTEGKFIFDKKRDIWDIRNLIRDIKKLEVDQIKKIRDYLAKEFSNKYYTERDKTISRERQLIYVFEKSMDNYNQLVNTNGTFYMLHINESILPGFKYNMELQLENAASEKHTLILVS